MKIQTDPNEWLKAGDPAQALMALSDRYKLDGDLLRCRTCERAINAYWPEPLRHGLVMKGRRAGHNCPHAGDRNPWDVLREGLDGQRARHAAAEQFRGSAQPAKEPAP